MPSAQAIVDRALRAVGKLASGETPSAALAQDSLTVLNSMIDAWGLEPGTMLSILRTATTLTNGTRDYTIGLGGAINIVRPAWLDAAGFIQDSTATDPIEAKIAVFTEKEWQGIVLKTVDSGWPTGVYYDRAFSTAQRGTISTYPTINISNAQLVLYAPLAITKFGNLADNVLLANGYEDAFHYNLTVRIAPEFGMPAPDGYAGQDGFASKTLAKIKVANTRPAILRPDPGLPGQAGAYWSQHAGQWIVR